MRWGDGWWWVGGLEDMVDGVEGGRRRRGGWAGGRW